jgi:hypothetical protein
MNMVRLFLLPLFVLRLLAPLADSRDTPASAQLVWCTPDAAGHEPVHDPAACALCQAQAAHLHSSASRWIPVHTTVAVAEVGTCTGFSSGTTQRSQFPRAPPLHS